MQQHFPPRSRPKRTAVRSRSAALTAVRHAVRMAQPDVLARRLWEAVEPLHAVAYFSPLPAQEAMRLGLKGWWMGYFAGRFAPLGPIGPAPATAMAFGFAPWMVARALPDAWHLAPPAAVMDSRIRSSGAALATALAGADDQVAVLGDLMAEAVTGCRFDGRPLAAGWSQVEVPQDPFERLWVLAGVLREHRGDGHVAAAVGLGLSGLETTITHVGAGALSRDLIQSKRGWTDEDWELAERLLVGRHLLDSAGRLTGTGEVLRQELEDATDRLARGPVDRLGVTRIEDLVRIAAPLARRLIDGGLVPVPNPIGAPRP